VTVETGAPTPMTQEPTLVPLKTLAKTTGLALL
jgi:hypothetical protein